MSKAQPGVVIVGSGLGGYTLARELRKADADKPITVISADGGESYSKPMLSAALAGGKTPAALVMKTHAQMAADLGITVKIRTRLTAIDPVERRITVSDGASLAYDDLVLALGADPRPYQVPGADRVTIHTVNDLDDYARWRDGLIPNGRVLLIGAGLIGCEFANDLASSGQQVTVVDPAPWPLGRLLPEPLGNAMAGALAGIGITLKLGRSIAGIEPGRAILDDGSAVAFDLALSAIGLVPRTALAAAAGLAVDRGIVVDGFLKTSAPHIYALGDCSQTSAGPLPFVAPLMAEAKALAATLAGRPTALALPALPVVVKTPALPCAVCPPPPGAQGDWVAEGEGRDLKALFVGHDAKPLGFALTGARVNERQTLAKDMPDLL